MEAPESRKSSVPIWIEKTFSGGREHGSVVDGVLVIFFSKGLDSVQGVLVRIWPSQQFRVQGISRTEKGPRAEYHRLAEAKMQHRLCAINWKRTIPGVQRIQCRR